MNNYRVKYKNEAVEIEIESSDKSYVDSKLAELLTKEVNIATPKSVKVQKSSTRKKAISKSSTTSSSATAQNKDTIDIAKIVSAINDDDDHSKVEKNILNKAEQLPKIIMCLHFGQAILNSPLTTGNIQTITDQLGIKIKSSNAGTTIKSNQKFFATDDVRKQGAIVKYKLNRKGEEAYKKILEGEKFN